jgi:uncharacterized membrane protein YkvA (DUF1232 family)
MRLRASWRRWFRQKRRRAQRLSAHPEAAAMTADRALEKGQRRQGQLRKAWDDLQVFVRLVRAWARGEYRDVSKGTIVLVLGALVYFLSPIDAILDAIPLIGYLDDAAIIAWVMSEVRAELDAFRLFEAGVRSGQAIAQA